MNLLTELKTLLAPLVPIETVVFSETPPDAFAVLTPLADSFELFADNRPGYDIQEVRISLFKKDNYIRLKNSIVHSLLDSGITITDRRYIGHESDTGYHHYAIDVAKYYELEE